MRTTLLVLSALFASCEATKLRFMPVELINEVNNEVNDTNYLNIGVNIRAELQGKLRAFLKVDGDDGEEAAPAAPAAAPAKEAAAPAEGAAAPAAPKAPVDP